MKPTEAPVKLSWHDRQKGSFSTGYKLAKEAKLQDAWIFNKSTRQWFTPDEFLAYYENKDFTNHSAQDLLEKCSIREPLSGITAAYKELAAIEDQIGKQTKELQLRAQALRDKIEAFNKRVLEHYKKG